MTESREQLVSQDAIEPEKGSAEPGLEIARTPELEKAIDKASELAEAIQHDRPVTAEQVLDLDEEFGSLRVMVGGEEMTVEEAREIPDLKHNMKIWREMERRNYDFISFSKLTYLTAGIMENVTRRYPYAEIDLPDVKFIPDKVMELLSKHDGDIKLTGLDEISENTARLLSQHSGGLFLSPSKQLSDEAAKHFVNFVYHLEIPLHLMDQIVRLKKERDSKK